VCLSTEFCAKPLPLESKRRGRREGRRGDNIYLKEFEKGTRKSQGLHRSFIAWAFPNGR